MRPVKENTYLTQGPLAGCWCKYSGMYMVRHLKTLKHLTNL